MEGGSEEDADRRREAAMAAAAASLRPNFKPKGGLTEAQLAKFQELHKRRLQIKAKSKLHNRAKGSGDHGKNKRHKKTTVVDDGLKDQEPGEPFGDSGSHSMPEKRVEDLSSMERGDHILAMKRRKLHWGLDTKERWERKSNM